MNKLTMTILIVIAVLAIALGTVVVSNDDDLPDITTTDSPSCNDLESDINSFLDNNDFCETDTDCTIVHLACPMGCYDAVNNNSDIDSFNEMINEFQQSCTTCTYSCIVPPEPRCVDNKCVVPI